MNHSVSVFDFDDYKAFLKAHLQALPKKGRGIKTSLARAIQCQTAYLSQVLHGAADLSFEQAERATHFLGLSKDESRFFLLLVHRGRAGTNALKLFYSEQIQELLKSRASLEERLEGKNELSLNDQAIYYSTWYYAAIHVTLTIPTLRTKESIAEHLRLPLETVSNALAFLCQCGLARFESGGYRTGDAQLFLGLDSPLVSSLHSNWRTKSIQSLESPHEQDLHYSAVITVSKKDSLKLRALLIQAIDDANQVINASPEEQVQAIALDFYKV